MSNDIELSNPETHEVLEAENNVDDGIPNQPCLFCANSHLGLTPNGSEALLCNHSAGCEGRTVILFGDETCPNYKD